MDIDTRKVEEWLDDKWSGAKECPVCGNNAWNIVPHTYETREFKGGDLVLPGSVIPHVVVMCNVCGYTVLFNAIAVGVAERGAKEESRD